MNPKNPIAHLIHLWRSRFGRTLGVLLSLLPISGLLLTLAGLWIFLEVADEVLEKQTETLDKALMLSIQQFQMPFLTGVMQAFSIVGGTVFVTLLCLILGAIFWFGQRRTLFVTFAITAIGGTGLNLLTKLFFKRDRPQLWTLVSGDPRTTSFPSGHAMMALIVYGFIGYLLARHFKRWRIAIALSTLLFVAIIGFSRLYLGIHWPTDVVAGQAAGLTWLSACLLGYEIRQQRHIST